MAPIELPADMELVETKPDAANIVIQPDTDAQLPRGRRPRKETREPVADEPLVQIETGRTETDESRSTSKLENA